LPQAGMAGSLKNRFVGTPLAGRVRAKTGSISRVYSLTGYIDVGAGKSITFSIEANHHAETSKTMLGVIDSLVVDMARNGKK
jgi:serine-type D-Ala-D-Ala carboxypeptidase/endopeptidase (penicillin-binding protein 4)